MFTLITFPYPQGAVRVQQSQAKEEAPEGRLLPSVLGCSPQPPACPTATSAAPLAVPHGARQQPPPSADSPGSAGTGDVVTSGDGDGDGAQAAAVPATWRAGPSRGEPGRSSTGSSSEASQAVCSPTANYLLSPLLGCPVGVTAHLLSISLGLCFLSSR